MLDQLKSTDFLPFVNEKFQIHSAMGEPVEVELIQVTDLGPQPSGEEPETGRRAFSILFRGPQNAYLPQQIYRLEHAQMGTFDLFLVPVGPDPQGMRFEAIFN